MPLPRVAYSGRQSAGPAVSAKSGQVGYVLSVPHATCLLASLSKLMLVLGADASHAAIRNRPEIMSSVCEVLAVRASSNQQKFTSSEIGRAWLQGKKQVYGNLQWVVDNGPSEEQTRAADCLNLVQDIHEIGYREGQNKKMLRSVCIVCRRMMEAIPAESEGMIAFLGRLLSRTTSSTVVKNILGCLTNLSHKEPGRSAILSASETTDALIRTLRLPGLIFYWGHR
ncbi:hypothetical protein FPV67DRAFT_1444551 [Lyophyllum atratum]|nr:hypothetical protein FPV67DRAFT_1444551 [Lyophyllum atratum]